MATAAFIAAAKQTGKVPVTWLAVESVNSIEKALTTQADWEGCALTNIDTVTVPGDATNIGSDFSDVCSDSYGTRRIGIPAQGEDTFLWEIAVATASDALAPMSIGVYDKDPFSGGVLVATSTNEIPSDGAVHTAYFQGERLVGGGGVALVPRYSTSTEWHFVWASSSLVTSTIDIGVVPTEPSVLSVDDNVPAGATLAFTVKGGNTDPPTTSLGAKVDGDSLAAYRYYQVTATFGSSAGAQAALGRIGITGGNSQFDHYSTRAGVPVASAAALLPPKPIASVSSKINLRDVSTTGEATVKMLWTAETGDKLAAGYLKNKTVLARFGFLGLSEADYEPILVGTWYDYAAKATDGIIEITIRDVLKQFQKVKIPKAAFNATTGAIETPPKTFTERNIIQVMLDLYEEIGINDRYLDRTTANYLRDNVFTGNAWKVTRTLADPEDAWPLLGELSTLSGVFLVPLPSGVLTMVKYDATAAAVDTIDARFCTSTPLAGSQKDLFTRQYIYYSPAVTDPGDDEADYTKGLAKVNAAAEIAWGEVSEQSYFEKWKLGLVSGVYDTTGQQAIADRWDSWFSTPKIRTTLKGVPLQHIGVNPGQVVAVDGMKVPVAAANWPGLTVGKKFLVMGKKIDLINCTLALDLMEL